VTASSNTHIARGIAIATATALIWAPLTTPPAQSPTAARAVTLTAAALPTTPYDPYAGPSLFDLIGRGVVIPSLGQAPPTPPPTTPIPGTTNANQAIKNIYNAVEPWVRYGFELATYAVGWVPWVGWLSGQIMIFYNFGERIVRSITFNVADWLFGPVPFLQGLGNVARDSWNALVQLGIDEWNFFLPPLPPLPPFPLSAKQTSKAAAPQPEAVAPAAVSGRGQTGRTARPARPNQTAALGRPSSSRRSESTPQKIGHAAPEKSPSKGVGRPKPR